MSVMGIDKKSESLEAMHDLWDLFKQSKSGKKDEKTASLMEKIK